MYSMLISLKSEVVCHARRPAAAGLRLLQDDRKGLGAVLELKSDEYLHAWECGSDEDGCWDDARTRARCARLTRRGRTP